MQIWDKFKINEIKDLTDLITGIGVLIAGIWILWKYLSQGEYHPKIEMAVKIRYIDTNDNKFLLELTADLTNKGSVRQYVKEFTFDLLYQTSDDNLECGEETINFQTMFKHKAISRRSWVPERWGFSFIDAGVCQQYTYLTSLPENAIHATLYSRFKHISKIKKLLNKENFHTASKTFNLKKLIKEDS